MHILFGKLVSMIGVSTPLSRLRGCGFIILRIGLNLVISLTLITIPLYYESQLYQRSYSIQLKRDVMRYLLEWLPNQSASRNVLPFMCSTINLCSLSTPHHFFFS